MFAQTLRDARRSARISIAQLADDSPTSRSAITDYEAGRKIPRIDTAERILNTLGQTYTTVGLLSQSPASLDPHILAPLTALKPDRAAYVAKARRDQAVIVDADANVEELGLS